MNVRNVKVPLKFVSKNVEAIDGVQELLEALLHEERFRTVEFGFTAKHSEYMEYGTGPHRGRSSYYIGKQGRAALDRWARIKLGMTDKTERASFVYFLARKIGREGLRPRPYFRPAVSLVQRRMEQLLNEGWSFLEIADEIGVQSKILINRHGMPFEGTLERSWFTRTLNMDGSVLQEHEGGGIATQEDVDTLFEENWS